MSAPPTHFADGAAYERFMGGWSRAAGMLFLDWLAPAPGLAWADIGCGNGAFTALLCSRCRPARLEAIDPSEGQLAFARNRVEAACANFRLGEAQALPYEDAAFDVAAMTLVLFFVPDPAKGVGEMRRIVRAGGIVAAYVWDIAAGGFPAQPVWTALAESGFSAAAPPRPDAASAGGLRALWEGVGLVEIAQHPFTVTRRFETFDAYWQASQGSASIRAAVAAMTPQQLARTQARVRALLQTLPGGAVAFTARANAIRGRVA